NLCYTICIMATINISLPQSMYNDAKKLLAKHRYASISELVREGLKRVLYPEITENGFTKEFEDKVLEAADEPTDKDEVWETPEDVNRFFSKLKNEIREKKK